MRLLNQVDGRRAPRLKIADWSRLPDVDLTRPPCAGCSPRVASRLCRSPSSTAAEGPTDSRLSPETALHQRARS